MDGSGKNQDTMLVMPVKMVITQPRPNTNMMMRSATKPGITKRKITLVFFKHPLTFGHTQELRALCPA